MCAEPDPPDRAAHPDRRPLGGELNAAVARGVVRICRSVVGRGPTKAQAFFRGDVFVVVMHETLTRAEKSLVADGQGDAVLCLRRDLHRAMRTQLITLVQDLTGCAVTALLSADHIVPDVSTEVFVLDQPVAGEWPTRRPPP